MLRHVNFLGGDWRIGEILAYGALMMIGITCLTIAVALIFLWPKRPQEPHSRANQSVSPDDHGASQSRASH
jgi:hypothetical protein